MKLTLAANGVLNSQGELVDEGISSSLTKIKTLKEYMSDTEKLAQLTTIEIANEI
jgi:hypothetical protein